MRSWNEAVRLNNHAVLLMGTGNLTDDETIIRNLQQAITHIQLCIREEMMTPAAAKYQSNEQPICCTVTHSSRQLVQFQDSNFFLFDQAFLLFDKDDLEVDGAYGSATLARKAWIETQSAIVLFNLALTYHRRANLHYMYQNDPLKREQCDAKFFSNTRSLFEKARHLYGMANSVVEGGRITCKEDQTDLFEGTKFALRLGIANNLVHISACTTFSETVGHQHDMAYQVQCVARVVEEGVTKAPYHHIPFSILLGITMNIVARKDGITDLFAPAA
jgi:hypothetical protein